MKVLVGRTLSNPVVKGALLTLVSDVILLYAKALVNVVKKKIERVSAQPIEIRDGAGNTVEAELID